MSVTASKSVAPRRSVHARAVVEAYTTTHARRSTDRATVEAGSLFGRLVPWDTPASVSDDGRHHYTESFAPGGLRAEPGTVVPVYAGHVPTRAGVQRGPLVGRVDDLEHRDDGLYGRVTLADVAAAAELRALADLVGATFSVEFTDDTPASANVIRTAATLTGLAVLTAPNRGCYQGAEVLAVRGRPGDDDPDDDDPDDDDGEGGEVPDTPGTEGGAAPLARARIEAEVRRALGRALTRPLVHPLARFETAYDFFAATRSDGAGELANQFAEAYHARALADQVTTNNPGVIPPGWLNEVFGIIDMGRPVVTAIGTRPLPAAGMDIDWPYFAGDLHALIGEQVTQKTEITSVRVDLLKASVPLKTYAGGSDISWQLIRRSQPSYREAYIRIMTAAYGVVTDNVVSDALPAVSGSGHVEVDWSASDPQGTALRGAIFEASAMVQTATGRPASVVLAASDVFMKFGAMPMLVPSTYGTQNVAGTATASTLDVSVSGLRVVLAPDMAAGTAVVTNSMAAAWFEDGPMAVSAQDVAKLGENVAVWGMGAFAALIPAGIVVLSDTIPLAAGDEDQGTKTSRRKAA